MFAERDIEIMFSIFDLTNRGYVDKTQYLKGNFSISLFTTLKNVNMLHYLALNAVGISEPTLPMPDGDKIDKTSFVSQM